MARAPRTVRKVESNLTDAESLALKVQTAPAWRPQVNETIKGKLIRIVKRQGDYDPYPCVILDTGAEDGSYVAVHAFHGVLLNQLRELRPTAGDELTILYAGKRANAKGKTDANGNVQEYHGYALFVNGADSNEEFDLDADVAEVKPAAPVAAPARKATARKAVARSADDAPAF